MFWVADGGGGLSAAPIHFKNSLELHKLEVDEALT